jgi:hypothetical protein
MAVARARPLSACLGRSRRGVSRRSAIGRAITRRPTNTLFGVGGRRGNRRLGRAQCRLSESQNTLRNSVSQRAAKTEIRPGPTKVGQGIGVLARGHDTGDNDSRGRATGAQPRRTNSSAHPRAGAKGPKSVLKTTHGAGARGRSPRFSINLPFLSGEGGVGWERKKEKAHVSID